VKLVELYTRCGANKLVWWRINKVIKAIVAIMGGDYGGYDDKMYTQWTQE
jgi:hypothetical protein